MNEKIIEFLMQDPVMKMNSIIEDIKVEVLCTMEERNRKLSICGQCEHLKNNFCNECRCYMPAKTFIKNKSCPLNLHDIN